LFIALLLVGAGAAWVATEPQPARAPQAALSPARDDSRQ
jgi:hypothetical protein